MVTAGCDRRRLHAAATAVLLAALPLLLAAAHPLPADPLPAAPGTPESVATVDDVQGLAVELTSVTPSALRPGESLQLEGRVTNVDDQVWRRVNAYLVISPSPLTSRAELAAAGDSAAESYFGDRIIDFGLFARLGGLTPGEFAPFRLRVPWSDLGISGLPGVYTVGVQVLATDLDDTRPTEGRVRTFVPLVDEEATADVRLALVWPLTGTVLRRADGTYARAGQTVRATSPGGRLRRMVDLGRTAGAVPLTVVPDPAVLDAAADLGSGDFGPPGGGAAAPAVAGSAVLATWLDDTLGLTTASTPWMTAYAEPAADTLASAGRPALTASVDAAGQAVGQQLLGGQERVLHLPRQGVVAKETLEWLRGPDGAGVVALAPRMLPEWEPLDGSVVSLPTYSGTLDAVVADPALAGGGPAPGEQLTALQVRQRLLAETALLGIETAAAGQPSTTATFVAPPEWDPGPDWPLSDFFTGLDVAWLQPVALDDLLTARRPYPGPTGVVDVDGEPVAELLPESMVLASAELDGRVRVLTKLVDGSAPLTRWYDAAVALGVSSAGLRDGEDRLRQTERAIAEVRQALRDVTITGPQFVTLSSARGRFPLTVTNRLDRPVTVSVAVLTEDAEPVPGAQFDTGESLTIRPGRSDTVAVDTRVGRAGVTSAKAYLLTKNGRRFGTPLSFSLRTSAVGTVIWVILGLACAVLVFAIARRLVRRARGLPVTGSSRSAR